MKVLPRNYFRIHQHNFPYSILYTYPYIYYCKFASIHRHKCFHSCHRIFQNIFLYTFVHIQHYSYLCNHPNNLNKMYIHYYHCIEVWHLAQQHYSYIHLNKYHYNLLDKNHRKPVDNYIYNLKSKPRRILFGTLSNNYYCYTYFDLKKMHKFEVC